MAAHVQLPGHQPAIHPRLIHLADNLSTLELSPTKRRLSLDIHDDETAATAVGVWHRAVNWFAMRGVHVERVLPDNGACYRSHAWRDACADLQIRLKRTRTFRP